MYVDLSTSRPTLIRQIEPVFRQKGASVVDAPVSGGKTGAATRHVAVMVGGERATSERLKPIFEAFGDTVFSAGRIGAGSVCRLVHTMIGHDIRQAIAEGLTLGVKAEVEPEALWACVRRGAVGRMSGLHEGLPRSVFCGTFEPASVVLALSRKDIALATALGREYHVSMPDANLAEPIVIEVMNRGWDHEDRSVTFRLQEEAAGVQVRAPAVDPESIKILGVRLPGLLFSPQIGIPALEHCPPFTIERFDPRLE
jgi:3-hydroxyisobutyrate dehydrogenase-like beta-hydroxyacid dehydrogenase